MRGRANANSNEIEFPDGHSDEYTSNVIAENIMYSQCDIEGRH
jgi:hypothetical protein